MFSLRSDLPFKKRREPTEMVLGGSRKHAPSIQFGLGRLDITACQAKGQLSESGTTSSRGKRVHLHGTTGTWGTLPTRSKSLGGMRQLDVSCPS